MEISRMTSVTEIESFIRRGLTYEEISVLLRRRNPSSSRGLSSRSVRRFCTENGLGRKCKLPSLELEKKVFECASEAGDSYGRKMLTGMLRSRGTYVGECKVGKIMRVINPTAQNIRRATAGRSLNPKVYKADYFGHKLHVDQNEKLVMFGVVHVCARDGFSGMIVSHSTMSRKNNMIIYDEIYKTTLERYGIWDQIRVDGGKEFVLLCDVQETLKEYRTNRDRLPFKVTKSTENNIIERIWVELNSRVNYPLKSILTSLVARDLINMSNEVTKFCVSWVTKRVSSAGLELFVASWNNHSIPKKGIPQNLATRSDNTGKIPLDVVPSVDDAVRHYVDVAGGELQPPEVYGVDPLNEYSHLQQQRSVKFYEKFGSDKDIFNSVMNGNGKNFEWALCYFQNLTIDLSNNTNDRLQS